MTAYEWGECSQEARSSDCTFHRCAAEAGEGPRPEQGPQTPLHPPVCLSAGQMREGEEKVRSERQSKHRQEERVEVLIRGEEHLALQEI